MPNSSALRNYVKATIRAEKARKNLTFEQISQELVRFGFHQTATNLSTKVARGSMSAHLFLAIMKVLGQKSIDLAGIPPTIS